MISKRRDDKGRVLQQGEWQEPSGRYRYKYTDSLGKRKILYSWRLTEADKMPEGKRADLSLREKERKVQSLQMQGITGSNITVLELVERYLSLKTGVKHNTLANYKFVVNVLKKEEFAYKKVDDVKLSDAKIFLIKLQRDGRGYSSIHSIRGVLRPAFQMAVDDDLILKNPFGFELGTVLVNDSQKRQAVSPEAETKFLDFVKNDPHYNQYYDAFYILFKTGLRISEFCGLTVKDLDFKEDIINVNHQLQRTREMKYIIVSTKTTSGTRLLPMESDVKEAFLRILKNRRKPKREPMVDGYGGFLFLDKNGRPMVALHWEKYMQHAREKYNREHLLQLPPITPHVCRHTYCTNMANSGMNPKTLQYLMGHSDISVLLLVMETSLVSLCMKIMSVLITVILYGRMIEIYAYCSVSPIPFATMTNREWGQIGNNYLKGLFALGFQGFLIMICVGIYAVLVGEMVLADNLHSAIFSLAAYTVILCFSLFKSGALAKSIFNAH